MTGVAPAEVSELAARFGLPPEAARRLAQLAKLLECDPAAPTTVRDARRVLDDHLADSLVALELPEVREARTIADLGSGAGVPGLPLAIARPAARVFLVESNARKCAFIARAAESIGITNARVVNARAEAWQAGSDRCDLVTARALAPLPVVAEYAAPLLRLGGALVVWRGARDPHEERAARAAADELGLAVVEPVSVRPYAGARNRHLHLMRKAGATPLRFPRRPGIARKRPLGTP